MCLRWYISDLRIHGSEPTLMKTFSYCGHPQNKMEKIYRNSLIQQGCLHIGTILALQHKGPKVARVEAQRTTGHEYGSTHSWMEAELPVWSLLHIKAKCFWIYLKIEKRFLFSFLGGNQRWIIIVVIPTNNQTFNWGWAGRSHDLLGNLSIFID